MTFTKEQLIERCRAEIELSQITLRNGSSDTPHAVEESVRLHEIALAALEAEPVGEVVLGEYDDCGCYPYARAVCIAADGQADWENFKDGTRLYAAHPSPVVIDERAAFNTWNNDENLPIAGVGAKNAAWLAWQARAKLSAPQPITTSERAELENYRNAQPVALVEQSDFITTAQIVGEEPRTRAVRELFEGALIAGQKLYAVPQPAPVVPGDISEELFPKGDSRDESYRRSAMTKGWDLCRAAMQSGAVKDGLTLREGLAVIRNSGIEIDADRIQAERDALNSPDCWCRTCRPVKMNDMRFVACPDCGNKRCPHANDHRNVCTGSNEPGQEGSAYPAAPQQEAVSSALEHGMARYSGAMQKLADGGD